MPSQARSVHGVSIRLTEERSAHITEEHAELAGLRDDVLKSIAQPDWIALGGDGELLAIRRLPEQRWLVAVYRELGDDGFVITAFLTRRERPLRRRIQLWP